jgi:hypothetical protein
LIIRLPRRPTAISAPRPGEAAGYLHERPGNPCLAHPQHPGSLRRGELQGVITAFTAGVPIDNDETCPR